MGLIEIRSRSERLGNLGGVREADVRTGAAGVLAGMADAAAQDGRSERALAGAVPGLLDGAKKLALEFAAAQERRDQEAADRYVARFRQGMDAYNNGSVDAQGNRVKGAMEADFDDSGAWIDGNVQYRDWFGAELGKELKMSDRAMEIARKRLVGYDLHMQNRWQGRAAQVDDLRARAAADENLAAARGTLLDCAVDGDTNELGADWALALDGYGEAVERALDAAHVPAEARPEARRRAALQICRDALARRLSRASEEALAPAAPTEESVRDAFGGLERSVASDGWEGVFPFGAAARTADGRTVADPLRAHLDGADLAAFRSAALTDIKSARSRALHEADARRRETERKTLEGMELVSREALAEGSLASIEDAIGRMDVEAGRHPKGSRLHVAAMEASKRLDAAADAAARRDDWDAILEHAADGTNWEPPKGSRMAKFHKALKASYDRQAQAYAAEEVLAADAAVQEERKANVAALRASMLEAAAVDPGGFSARLAEAAEKGHVTLDQYRRLRDEFRDVWTKEGMPQKAKSLVDILKREFYPNADYDLNDRLAVNPKSGRFEYGKDPETKKPFAGEDVEFEAQKFVPYDLNSWGGLKDFLGMNRAPHYETTTRTLTSDEQLKMLDWAMELARHDGEWISTDPQTGAKLDRPRKLDAVAEFEDACSRMRTSKRAEASQDLVMERANAMLSLRAGFAQADDAVTGAAAKREAVELKTREALKSAKRRPFAPKMPGGQRGEGAASEGEED